jgi:NAD-dependent deacetylase
MIEKIDPTYYINITVLTGAGISVASGLRPFRGPGGIWNDNDIRQFATKKALEENPYRVWRFHAPLRDQLKITEPNAAHYALAKFESKLKDYQKFTLITQNIDGLHQKAGSKNVIELHGNVNRTICTDPYCEMKPYIDLETHLDEMPTCKICNKPLRMDIVLFGEGVNAFDIKKELPDCDLFIAIGTSGVVHPAAGFADIAKLNGARTILINLEDQEGAHFFFHERILGKAEEILPALLGVE